MRVTSATPLNPAPNAGPKLRSPPKVIPIRSKGSSSMTSEEMFSTLSKELPTPDKITEINYPKLPVVCIRNTKTPNSRFRTMRYSKYVPKVLEIKPLFHTRVKSYNPEIFENDYYKHLKSTIPNLDYY